LLFILEWDMMNVVMSRTPSFYPRMRHDKRWQRHKWIDSFIKFNERDEIRRGEGSVKFGCCAAIEYSEHVRQAGFDFMECTVVSLVPEKGKYEFAEIFRKYKESPLPVEACNVLLPGDMRIVGEQVNEDRIKSY